MRDVSSVFLECFIVGFKNSGPERTHGIGFQTSRPAAFPPGKAYLHFFNEGPDQAVTAASHLTETI